MRRTRTPRTRFAALLLLAATGALAAPDVAPAPAPTGEANLSPSQLLAQAKEYASKMQDSLRTIVQLEEVAKKLKDVIKLNCVKDKRLQTKGHLTLAETAMSGLNEAVAKSDDVSSDHEYKRVTILYQKILVLATEAGNCIGEDLSYVGATTVTVTVTGVPDKDTTAFSTPGIDPNRVPAASAQ